MIAIVLSFILIVLFLYIIYFGFLQQYLKGSNRAIEGFTNEETMIYLPDPKTGMSREVKVGEWVKESQLLIGFCKVDNKLMKETTTDKNAYEQYRADPTSLEGYKITSSYETNDDNLNKKYGEFFTVNSWPDKLAKPTEFEDFKRKWINVCMPVSLVYSKIHYHFRMKDENRKKTEPYDETYFAKICFEWMEKCRESSQDNLEKAKIAFYNIVRKQEIQSEMTMQYINNAKYMNQDEALYILNTTEDFLSKAGEPANPKDTSGFIEAGGIISKLHNNYVVLYQIAALLYGIMDWIQNSERNGNKLVKTGPEQIYSGFEKYVNITQPNMKKADLFIYYVLENIPVRRE